MDCPPSLAAFFVFNPTLGEEETESRKNLFFHPPIDSNRQKDYIGLTEGLINFTRDFSPDKPCEALRCEKTRHAFYECEPNFWIVLIMNNPYVHKDRNKTSPVYLEDELGDSSLQAIVKRTYATFRMFNGTMASIADTYSYDFLRDKLKAFMSYFVPTIDFKSVCFSMDIRGFSFMPVTRPAFLMIQYIMNIITASFLHVASCAVMYDKKLIWSGLEQEDMFFLYLLDQGNMQEFYEYLARNPEKFEDTSNGDRKMNENRGSLRQDSARGSAASWVKDVGFLTGPSQMNEELGASNAPPIFLQTYKWKRMRLAVFKYSKITLFMVMHDVKETTQVEVYNELSKQMQADLRQLDVALSRQVNQVAKPSNSYRFLYFNALNLALVSSLTTDNGPPIAMDTIKLIRKIHEDFQINPWKGYEKPKESESKHEDTNETSEEAPKPETETVDRKQPEKESQIVRAGADSATNPDEEVDTTKGESGELKKSTEQPTEGGDADGVVKVDEDDPNANGKQDGLSNGEEKSPEGGATTVSATGNGQDTEGEAQNAGESKTVPEENGDDGESSSQPDAVSADTLPGGESPKRDLQADLRPDEEGDFKEEDELGNEDEGASPAEELKHGPKPNELERGTPVHVAMRTKNDGWLVASKATQTQREFFVLIDDKNGNLSSIQEEVNRLARSYFAKIFMH